MCLPCTLTLTCVFYTDSDIDIDYNDSDIDYNDNDYNDNEYNDNDNDYNDNDNEYNDNGNDVDRGNDVANGNDLSDGNGYRTPSTESFASPRAGGPRTRIGLTSELRGNLPASGRPYPSEMGYRQLPQS